MDVASYDHPIRSVVYSPDGNQLAVGGNDGVVHVVDLTDTSKKLTIEAGNGPIGCVRFSGEGQKLAVVSDTTWRTGVSGRVDIWDLGSMRRARIIYCPSAVGVAGFDDTGNILTAEWNGTLRTWSPIGEQIAVSRNPKDVVSAMAFSPNTLLLKDLALSNSVVKENK